MTETVTVDTWLLRLEGRVQGVGFRPFVYRQATARGLHGWVLNANGEVRVAVQGPEQQVDDFRRALLEQAPPLSRPRLVASDHALQAPLGDFRIRHSAADGPARIHVPPDYFACDECRAEMADLTQRRHRYPFINCTQCGPRYTLIRSLPYDRPNTSMAGFPLCPDCAREYGDPTDRRFHAQPLACPVCGPHLWFQDHEGQRVDGDEAALAATVAALRAGRTVAVKGIGGYHLLVDAGNEDAVAALRRRKPRPHKPLAVMYPQRGPDGLQCLRRDLIPDHEQARWLRDPERPIVLCRRRAQATLASGIAPGLEEVGAMLPYSPLHHLLLDAFDAPLVATSGNLGGEPVLTEPEQAGQRLARIADAFLHHDRPILRPADDSVLRVIGGRARPLRVGRGRAPLELSLARPVPYPVLAVGGQMKNTVALAWDHRVVVSPHIGDLQSPRSQRVFEQVIDDLQDLYGVRAQRVLCDAHPDYASSRWARRCGLAQSPVFHHRAHASALCGEHPEPPGADPNTLVFTWDGVGYGEDGTLWGGEALLGRPGHWRRVASLRPFRLPGGERAGREPWRAALGVCWESATTWPQSPPQAALLQQAWQRGLNSPRTSAAGRLFDAAAALLGVVGDASFEGQGPMYLEAVSAGQESALQLPVTEIDGREVWDWAALLPMLLDTEQSVSRRGGCFHASLAAAILALARRCRQQHGVQRVGLGGGVFQNRLLSELSTEALESDGFQVLFSQQVPCNDGGLSFGQVVEWLGASPPR